MSRPTYVHRAAAYQKKGKTELAMVDLANAIRLSPKATTASDKGVLIHREIDNLEQVIVQLTQIIAANPKRAACYNLRGVAFEWKGDFSKAIPDFTRAIRLDPKDPSSYNNRSGAYLLKKDFDPAIADCDAAIRLDPTQAATFNNRGVAYEGKGDLDKAMATILLPSAWTRNFARRMSTGHIFTSVKEISVRPFPTLPNDSSHPEESSLLRETGLCTA